jgi:hypothetical protein
MLAQFAEAYHTIQQFLFGWIDPLVDYVFSRSVNDILFDGVWLYSRIYNYVRSVFVTLSVKYTAVKVAGEAISGACSTIYQFTKTHKTEPTRVPWGCIVSMPENGNYQLDEQYVDLSDDLANLPESYMSLVHIAEQQTSPKLVILKTPDMIYCNMSPTFLSGVPEKSQVKFIMVEYKAPSMKEGIPLTLDPHWFYCGNQLLSAPFVLRCLQYQSSAYTFDGDYVITLIDSNVNTSQIRKGQHIVLEKTNYRIEPVN